MISQIARSNINLDRVVIGAITFARNPTFPKSRVSVSSRSDRFGLHSGSGDIAMGTNNDNIIVLKVEVPIACFRDSRAREYIATYPIPPPSTVYGMLLSTVGEENRFRHCGVKLAITMLSETTKSRVIRKIRRFKVKDIHSSKNSKPDYQELLTGIKFVIWIDATADKSTPNLSERLQQAMSDPSSVVRFGNICLGESRDLLNSIYSLTILNKES